MSYYDYTALVSQFHEARRRAMMMKQQHQQQQQEQLQTAVELMQELVSLHGCPLTPLLWIQYGQSVSEYCRCCAGSTTDKEDDHDDKEDSKSSKTMPANNTAATRLELEVLQVGCREFPGSALLWLRRVSVHLQHCLVLSSQQHHHQDDDDDDDKNDTSTAWQSWKSVLQLAIQAVGRGSHRNQDAWVVTLYRLWAWLETTAIAAASSSMPANNNKMNDPNIDDDGSGGETLLLAQAWIQRSQTPMKHANDSIASEWKSQSQQLQLLLEGRALTATTNTSSSSEAAAVVHPMSSSSGMSSIACAIEEGRRQEARLWNAFATREDEIDWALQQEGIAVVPPVNNNHNNPTDDDLLQWEWDAILQKAGIDWDTLLPPETTSTTYGMGYGGTVTAHAFAQYAHALQQFRLPKINHDNQDDNDNDDVDRWQLEARVQTVALDVYERGVAECPTVEALWLAYLRDLQHWIVLGQQQQQHGKSNPLFDLRASLAAARFGRVAQRACRNCPYSVALLQQKLLAVLLLASWSSTSQQKNNNSNTEDDESGAVVVVDPDQLLEYVQNGLDTQFLPKQASVVLDLYLTAIRVVKRHILWILAHRLKGEVHNDDCKQNGGKKTAKRPLRQQLAYDDSEPMPNSSDNNKNSGSKLVATNNSNDDDDDDDDALQEAQDLLEDLGDMYDQVESRLRQSHPSWTEGRALLWKDRAQTELLLEHPLRQALACDTATEDHSDSKNTDLQSLEKCIRSHNPPHPDLYSLYIRQYITWITTTPATKPEDVVVRIRRVRGLFEKALHSVGNTVPKVKADSSKEAAAPAPSTCLPLRDYSSALASLCHEWLDFERTVGSERSLGKASKIVEKKFHKAGAGQWSSSGGTAAATSPQHPTALDNKDEDDGKVNLTEESPSRGKRKYEDDLKSPTESHDETDHGPTKKPKVELSNRGNAGDDDVDAMETEAIPAKETKPAAVQTHKVKIGKLEYPAHPFTVRVSNLSPQVQEMDLVDLFRPKCGAIVHARIMREKHHPHGGAAGRAPSRGWGLIQFEERESVEKALVLNDVVGLHEKLVRVERSHMPAAALVPPGMHRVRPTGEGKVSKRNEKRRDQQQRKLSEDSGVHQASAAGAASALDSKVNDSVAKGATTDVSLKQTSGSSAAAAAAATASGKKTSVLSFRPRGVARKAHPKQRLQLDDKGSVRQSDKP